MKQILLSCTFMLLTVLSVSAKEKKELWPDGTPMEAWFSDTTKIDAGRLGTRYVITDYGVRSDSTIIQTRQIQAVIDKAARNGGGVIVIPEGTFLTGSLFFRQGTNLYLERGGKLKGSDRIVNYPIVKTRIEGQTCSYFAALINADGLNGFTIAGEGTIDGNGFNYWQEFWIRRQCNPQCTNKEALRPRLVYISNCTNVTLQDVRLVNSAFWTNHLYRSNHVRYLHCYIYAPTSGPVKAPSSDAIDVDFCHDVLINGCYMNVNDDAVVMKGGKGTWADKDSTDGPNRNILIENCHYGTVHGCLTLGSESIEDHNVVLRHCYADHAQRVLWLKLRPDTPQQYGYVTVDGFTGKAEDFLVVRPWSQFFKPERRDDMPLSRCHHIVMKNIRINCKNFFDVSTSDKYQLDHFTFENINVTDEKNAFDPDLIPNSIVKKVIINGKKF
ncbi:MAG: glycosyl hydrolase family 28 protein [Prevotella sp.]|mgnify:FL=1|jgi:polygalacturonase|nr:glycosyl hydrolase family 28 protein [Prevotella sp.]MCI1548945.1 glycosyl hydrolase family 28 protein [Prevotella sp.]MCI1595546.1 glycosyl hydrolase family 28 protein [Prevotella sp.]